MTEPHFYTSLEAVVQDDLFPSVDLALREGRHIASDEPAEYGFVREAQTFLEPFYRRYGCELVQVNDGYFYLRPTGDRLGRRHLSAGEMLVGQALALLYLDPATVQSGGTAQRSQIIELLDNLVGKDKLIQALNRRRSGKKAERVAHDLVRKEIDQALRSLYRLGFVELLDGDRLRLRPPVLRFADAVRGIGDPAAGLERLIARRDAMLAELEATAGEERDEEDAG